MGSLTVSLKLYQLRKQAKEHPERVFTTLHHLIDVEFLKRAYHNTRKDAAVGIDEVTAEEYAEHLDDNLHSLYQRYKEGSFVTPFVRRVWIEKEDGSQRPIGIPAFEDKILQRAVAMLLGAIYETGDEADSQKEAARSHTANQGLDTQKQAYAEGVVLFKA